MDLAAALRTAFQIAIVATGFATGLAAAPADLAYLRRRPALLFRTLLATIVAAHKGLNASGGPKGVADGVNQAVVLSVILLAMANVGITQAYVMLVPQGMA